MKRRAAQERDGKEVREWLDVSLDARDDDEVQSYSTIDVAEAIGYIDSF